MLEERALRAAEREAAYLEKAQRNLAHLVKGDPRVTYWNAGIAKIQEKIEDNSTLPCTISSLRVVGAPNTRKSFLERIFKPILSVNQDRPYTLTEAIREVSIAADKLHRLGILVYSHFHDKF